MQTPLTVEIEDNLARARPWGAQAAAEGARLVVCPEFLAAGYVYDESIWRASEPRGGPTETWLAARAREHRIFIGASYLEAEGDEFYNTFALFAPDGGVCGRVRKESLPAFEGWYFRSCEQPKVIATELGRIAVGICQDNHTARFMKRLCRDDVDLVLMPHSAPCVPFGARMMREALAEVASFYASRFGVPTVLVNKVHSRSRTPVPGLPLLSIPFDFPGLSTVCDSDGRILDQLAGREGIVVAEVTLDPLRKKHPPAPRELYWSRPPRRFGGALGLWFMLMERLGKRAYERNAARPRAARAAVAARPARPAHPHLTAV